MSIQRLLALTCLLAPLNGPGGSSAQRLLELYASLTGKKVAPSPSHETMPVWFHVTTPLSKPELLYAIETTFALDNLQILLVNEESIRLGER